MVDKIKLRVSHFPQIQCAPFVVNTDNIEEALRIKNLLADYDLFEYNNRIKPDYANMTIIEYFDGNEDEWFSLDEFDIEELLNGDFLV